ncbi:MAG: hypothetical protein IKE52_03420 [Mogibacterium sp.]|nr:hypothetical protein [Mogibacterium sp.]
MLDIDKEMMDYFRELSPRERKLRFEAIVDDGAVDDEMREFCELLYNERYRDPKKPDKTVDKWLFKMVYLPGLFRKRRFFRSGLKREKGVTLSELHLDNPAELSEMESTVLYYEYRNTAKRYLSTCGSADYGNSFFGLKKAEPEDKKLRACEDVWMASRGFAIATDEAVRLELWCRALYDELMQYDSSLKRAYEEMEEKI